MIGALAFIGPRLNKVSIEMAIKIRAIVSGRMVVSQVASCSRRIEGRGVRSRFSVSTDKALVSATALSMGQCPLVS